MEGLLTSQDGDIDQEIQWFHVDHLAFVAVVLTVFPLVLLLSLHFV